MAELKNRLKDLRASSNITLEEIAEKTNISLKELEKIEKKNHNPSIKNALKLANFFSKSVEDIFYLP